MTKSIIRYIEYLKMQHGLDVTLHGRGLSPYLSELAPYNVHDCPYCMYVKSSEECLSRCRESQRRALNASREGAFFGSCYAGVSEFVFPVRCGGDVSAFISVGGYIGSPSKRHRFSEAYGFHEGKLCRLAKEELKAEIPDFEFVKTVIEPLCAMLSLLLGECGIPSDRSGDVYGKILSIIHTEYSKKLTVRDIAEECHYSISFVSRHFKEKKGISIQKYIFRLRMKRAERLLTGSNMSIEDIGAAVGFSDTNYFISSFSSYFGMPPKKYRLSDKLPTKENNYIDNKSF